MKKIFILMAIACASQSAMSQWTTNGANINTTNTGNVGIGTTTPAYKLDVGGTIRSGLLNQLAFTTERPLGLSLQQVNLNGDYTNASNYLSVLSHNVHHNGTNWIRRNQYSRGWANVMNHDYYEILYVNENSPGNANENVQPSSYLRITTEGKVGIGTTTPGSNRLAVEGRIGASEIKVTLQRPWPDYVFAKGYKLPSLSELESFIQKNRHLPGIPSAKEMSGAGGVELGDMTSRLLEKIEQLTLYVIELKKENDTIKEELAKIKSN